MTPALQGWICLLAAGGGGGDPMGFEFHPNAFKLSLWTFVTFVVVLVLLWKFAWGPILQALEERSEGIRNDIEGAEKNRTEAEALKADYQSKLDKAREEVIEIVEEGKRDAAVIKDETLSEARDEASKIKERAERETKLGRDKALEEVWDTASELATELAGKLIARDLKADDHKDLIAEVVEQYKAAAAGGTS